MPLVGAQPAMSSSSLFHAPRPEAIDQEPHTVVGVRSIVRAPPVSCLGMGVAATCNNLVSSRSQFQWTAVRVTAGAHQQC